MPSPSVDPDNPHDPRGAPMTLSGTVHVAAGCVTLDVRTARWLLTGRLAATLQDGSTVTVRGRPTAVPATCTAEYALDVQAIG